ncbi:MAG TPA: hypothetical protein VF120_06060 [Ktedonobacterales bacterium]
MAGARVLPGLPVGPYLPTQPALTVDPDVWLIALATAGGGLRSLDGVDRPGAIRVSRPYGHLRSLRPVLPLDVLAVQAPGEMGEDIADLELAGTTSGATRGRRSRGSRGLGSGSLASGALHAARSSSRLPAERVKPQLLTAVEIETDAGLFRVERPHSVLAHTDLAWALANLEPGEPESLVPMPRRRLALLLTLLPTPADPERPEEDPVWGWAHRLKAPWERGPLHPRGRLGRLIAVDPDPSTRGMHRACFEMLGSDEIVWALGVPCYRTDSVYELVPLRRSRWLSWPLAKGRSKAGDTERPEWEIARVVYRVGAPRWPLAGVIDAIGPLGVAG